MMSYAVPVEDTGKFSLAPSALASNALKFSLQRRKNRENFRSRLRRAKKLVVFVSLRGFAPPSGKIPAGAYGRITGRYRKDEVLHATQRLLIAAQSLFVVRATLAHAHELVA